MQGQSDYLEMIKHYRDSVDAAFTHPETTILGTEDLAGFHGLNYFEPDLSYKVKARFKASSNGDIVSMKTSGTKTKDYRAFGVLTFRLHGKKCKLTLYQSADPKRPELKNYLLLAFTDPTNGHETYGGGRYIEYTTADVGKEMTLDFNYCFNPYCAYSDGFNCVVPPSENALKVPVKAGVKKYHD